MAVRPPGHVGAAARSIGAARGSAVMIRLVAAQLVTSMVVAAGAWMIGGHRAAMSSLLGGLACALPNGLFALNLARLAGRSKDRPEAEAAGGASAGARAFALALLVGEFVKVVLTIGLLILIAETVREVVWPALIVGVIAVLSMQAAALIWR